MSGSFSIGETKVRPGVYFRSEKSGAMELPGITSGVVGVAFKANWGPLGQAVELKSISEIASVYGDDSGTGSNVAVLEKVFMGGASRIQAVRVGAGGTKASHKLKDTTGTPVEVVTLTAKHAGTRALSVTIKDSLADTTKRECIIYSGTKELCKVLFAKGNAGEVDALVAAVNASPDCVVTAAKAAAGNGILAAVTQQAFGTAGVSPTVATNDYGNALTVLEATEWNTICVDSDDTAVHALIKTFMARAAEGGHLGIAVIGEPTSVAYATRKSNAAAFNTPSIVYVLNGFTIGETDYEGFNAAAVVAGLIAYLPSNSSPTHKAVPGATGVKGALTNGQIVECLGSGALVFSTSTSGAVWIEQGINTLTTLTADQDAGWKKIRRTKTRYELMLRIHAATEGVVGNVGNDSNGSATVVAIANGIINAMIAEGKLVSGSARVDPANPAQGDSAWFIVEVLDLDSIEKVYVTYRFRFSD